MLFTKIFLLILTVLNLNSLGFTQSKTLDVSHCIPALDTLDGQVVMRLIEKMPEFKGGTEMFYKWLAKNINVDARFKKMGLDGKFYFTFVIDTLGNLRNFCVIKPNYSLIDESTISQLNQNNLWQSGENNDKKVPVRLILPVSICFR